MDFDQKNRSNNYTIQYNNNNFGTIMLFVKINNKKYIIVDKFQTAKDIKFDKTGNFDVNRALQKYNNFFKIVISQNVLDLICLENIVAKCILITINPKLTYITPCVDLDEFD